MSYGLLTVSQKNAIGKIPAEMNGLSERAMENFLSFLSLRIDDQNCVCVCVLWSFSCGVRIYSYFIQNLQDGQIIHVVTRLTLRLHMAAFFGVDTLMPATQDYSL